MRLRVGAGTDTGRVRALNEDAYMLRADEGLFVVCDGMGGAPAGEVASQMAVDAIRRELREPASTGPASGEPAIPAADESARGSRAPVERSDLRPGAEGSAPGRNGDDGGWRVDSPARRRASRTSATAARICGTTSGSSR